MATFNDVKVTYFDIPAIGRGEVIRLYLEDNGVAFTDNRITLEAWFGGLKAELTAKNPAGYVPITEIDGTLYTEHIATCRYIARRLGQYGNDAEKDYYADAVSSLYEDWRAKWVAAAFGTDEEVKKKHNEEELPKFLALFEHLLERYVGPFVCGEDFTFADAAVFQIIHDEEKNTGSKLLGDYPRLARLQEAVAARPNIAAYLASERRHEA